jgi:hypothetical protein
VQLIINTPFVSADMAVKIEWHKPEKVVWRMPPSRWTSSMSESRIAACAHFDALFLGDGVTGLRLFPLGIMYEV